MLINVHVVYLGIGKAGGKPGIVKGGTRLGFGEGRGWQIVQIKSFHSLHRHRRNVKGTPKVGLFGEANNSFRPLGGGDGPFAPPPGSAFGHS